MHGSSQSISGIDQGGDVDVATDRAASALSNYRDALKIGEQLSSTAASNLFLRRDLAGALLQTGDALSR